MNMTDGLDYKEINATSLADNDVVNMMYGRGKYDVLAYARDELPLVHEPGDVWNYSSAAYHLIGWAFNNSIEQSLVRKDFTEHTDKIEVSPLFEMSGLGDECTKKRDDRLSLLGQKDFRDVSFNLSADTAVLLSNTQFFCILGINAQPEFDTSGTFLGGSLVWASARDFAKFGYLYLRDGVWDDERLLPEGWVDFARTNTPADNANIYGAGWWITAYGEERTHAQNAKTPPWDAFHAGGHEGQTIWVVPSRDLVIVRLGLMTNATENWEALYEWNQEIARLFPELEG
jgi:CubicO group peptidase (beta-lactamase class C family)